MIIGLNCSREDWQTPHVTEYFPLAFIMIRLRDRRQRYSKSRLRAKIVIREKEFREYSILSTFLFHEQNTIFEILNKWNVCI